MKKYHYNRFIRTQDRQSLHRKRLPGNMIHHPHAMSHAAWIFGLEVALILAQGVKTIFNL